MKLNTEKCRRNAERGITLIALIITVIILLILAGTAISISVNGGDLFSKATTARESWNNAVAEENSTISNYLSYFKTNPIQNELLTNINGETPEERSSYVNYIDANSNTLLCRVLHNDSQGLDIVTDDVIKNGNEIVYVTLGANDPTVQVSDFGDSSLSDDARKASASYNKALATLNSLAETYRNKTDGIALSARCVGSSRVTTVESQDTNKIDRKGYKESDLQYMADYYVMRDLDILGENIFWLASRFNGGLSCDNTYSVRCVNPSKENPHVYSDYLAQLPYQGTLAGKSVSLGIRVVFHIDVSKVIIDGGSGTKEDPYTLKVNVLTSVANNGMVAQIGSNTYSSVQAAINAARNDTETIVLLEDVSENISIPTNKNVRIDLNGHTITNNLLEPIITVSGKLTLLNGTIIGEGTRAIFVNESGEINLSNTLVDKTLLTSNTSEEKKIETITVYGKLNIDSGKVTTPNDTAIYGRGANSIISISGTAVIEQASQNSGFALIGYGEILISGGSITANYYGIRNYGTMRISGGTVYKSGNVGNPAVSNEEGGHTIMTGGTIISHKHQAFGNYNGLLEISGTAELIGYDDSTGVINNSTSSLIITGGKISSENKYAIENAGTLEISGTAEIEATGDNATLYNHQSYNYDTNSYDYPTVTITGGTITSTNNYAIYNRAGTLYLSPNCTVIGETSGTITPYSGN